MAERSVGLASAKALGDDRPEVVGDELVERAIRVAEVRRRKVDDDLRRRRDLVNDLEVEDRLALRLLGRPPRRVALDRHQGVIGRQAELGRELVEVAQVRQVVDLRKDDRDARSVETRVS